MILTGKAKEDFLEWYGTGEKYFDVTLKEIEQHVNIIEWFSSDTDIEIEYILSLALEQYKYIEASKQAIIKANKIYNEKFRQG